MPEWTEEKILHEAKGFWVKDENIYTAVKGDWMFRYIPKLENSLNKNLPALVVRRRDAKSGRWLLVAYIHLSENYCEFLTSTEGED